MNRCLALVVVAACGSDVGVAPEAALQPRVRMITDAQYANVVRDLLAIEAPAIHSPGTRPHQFIHDDVVLAVDSPLLVQYRLAAEAIAKRVADRTCDRACVETFATRAFRRPLEEDELERLWALHSEDDGGFALVVEAVLQAPSFIYRTERGAELDAYELASAVAFLFYDSIPDEPLWQAARDGSLTEPGVLAAHVDRLLDEPRVQAHLTGVVLSWLDVHDIETMYKHPDFHVTPALRRSMIEQARMFVHDVLWERGGGFRELMTSNKTYIDAQLAPIYGVQAGTWQLRPFEARERAGILTHPGVLTMLGTGVSESIIFRGIYVHRKFLCTEELGRPPFAAIREAESLTIGFSDAQQAHFRAQHLYCRGCHQQIDPPGFALHHYDVLGRYRETDGGIAIEDDVLLPIDGGTVKLRGAAELARVLADSEQAGRCVVDQLAHHALGRAVSDVAMRGYLYRAFERSDRDIVEVFRAIATSPMFRRRQ